MPRFGRKRAKPSVITLADEARDQEQWERAAGYYREALQRKPQNPPIWVQYGHVLKESGHCAEAERAYRTAIAYDPGSADAHLQLGHVLKIHGKKEEAGSAYLRAVALDPSLTGVSFEFAQLGWSEAHVSALKAMLHSDTVHRPLSTPEEHTSDRLLTAANSIIEISGRDRGVPTDLAALTREVVPRENQFEGSRDYNEWVRLYDTIDDNDRVAIAAAIKEMTDRPLISVIMPVYNTPEPYLRGAIDSVRRQLYPNWELCIADDASTAPHIRSVLEHYRIDPRIKVCYRNENGHISAASNSALALATGSFVTLLDHDDVLPEHALYMVAATLNSDREVDLIYSDEDKIDENGQRFDPHFKSDWNPDLMLSQNMFCHLGVFRRGLVEKVGGFRCGFEGSQDYDLVLRAQRLTTEKRIRHIPHILYHWRAIPGSVALDPQAKPYAVERARKAITDHLAERGFAAEVLSSPHPDFHRVRYPLPKPVPRVTVVLPTRDRVDLLRSCLEGLLQRTDYPDVEILIIDNRSLEPATRAYFEELRAYPRIRVLPFDAPFNYSAINNFAVEKATGQLICLLNNDTEVINSDWLMEMAAHASRPGIGAVGALLYYPDNRIQHGGIILGPGGVAGHAHHGLHRGNCGYFARAMLIQNLSAVTAACLVVPKSVFDQVGGFNSEDLAVAYNDVDLCLRIREAGYQIVWTPHAELYHYESASRGPDTDPKNAERANSEIAYMLRRWGHFLDQDPYYNPNLRRDGDFGLAFPPRIGKPWRRCDSGQAWLTRVPITAGLGNIVELEHRYHLVRESGFFDPNWYLQKYPDIARHGVDPFMHFLNFGSSELRSPGPDFDAAWYFTHYPDVKKSGQEPIFHYLNVGRFEARATQGPPIYQHWRDKFDTLTDWDVSEINAHINTTKLPTATLMFSFDNRTEQYLEDAILRLKCQIYKNWTALLIIDRTCSKEATIAAQLAAERDKRISIFKQGSAHTTLHVKEGDCIIFASGNILLREHAIYMFVVAASGLDRCVVYGDEDTFDKNHNPTNPLFKPDYSPQLFQTVPGYLGSCFLVKPTPGILSMLNLKLGKGEYEITEFVTSTIKEQNNLNFIHLPTVLFHDMSPPTRDHIVRSTPLPDLPHEFATVSIIIPTKDRLHLLEACVSSIYNLTEYPRAKWEIIVLDNGSVESDTLRYLATATSSGLIRRIRNSDKFNFARLNNIAAASSNSDVLVFLNNDTVVIDGTWLKRLVSFAMQNDVGAVGAKLLYPDRTVQHGGVVLGIQGVAAHCHVGLAENEGGFGNLNNLTREVSAVTGACLAMRRALFFEIGGFEPQLAVAFNDTVLCLDSLKKGYRNIWVSEPLLLHHESKTRGFDDTPEKRALFAEEARVTRRRHDSLFKDDPYYNPNLSVERPYELAFPPRRVKPWQVCFNQRRGLRILILSATHQRGHGVATVMELQSTFLVESGHEVYVGGPIGTEEMPYRGCNRVQLNHENEAASFAVEKNIDCIIVHTPPFFSVVRYLGIYPFTVFYDHGEPPPDMFPDAATRKMEQEEKKFCFTLADQLIAISPVVRSEIDERDVIIIPNCNSHLALWNNDYERRRQCLRLKLGWEKKFVVLNVCRFHKPERYYKGVDRYADIFIKLRMAKPEIAARITFVLCGKASQEDVEEMRPLGFEIFANASDQQLIELYAAADVYVNLSRWEGYNLGVGQALAMGLPVIASNIPAHRAFPGFASDKDEEILDQIVKLIERAPEDGLTGRKAWATDWTASLVALSRIIDNCYHFKYDFVRRYASHFATSLPDAEGPATSSAETTCAEA